jgi:hypothetical protein
VTPVVLDGTEQTPATHLRTWDESTRTFLIDTAETTTFLGTETLYIKVTTKGSRFFYKEITTIIQCGNEVVNAPSAPVSITV